MNEDIKIDIYLEKIFNSRCNESKQLLAESKSFKLSAFESVMDTYLDDNSERSKEAFEKFRSMVNDIFIRLKLRVDILNRKKSGLKVEIDAKESELKANIDAIRSELKAKIEAIESELIELVD